MTKSSQTLLESRLVRTESCLWGQQDHWYAGSNPTEFGIFDMATFDLVLKVTEAGENIYPVNISLQMASFSGNSPQICFCDVNPHRMNLNSIAHHGIMLDEEYQDSREQ